MEKRTDNRKWQKVAIIDMGTNTFNLVKARYNDLSFQILNVDKIGVKLGEGGISNSRISKMAQERGLDVLRLFRASVDAQEIDEINTYATSAVRSAKNCHEFLDKIRKETGFEPVVIDGKQEAMFIYEGVKIAIQLSDRPCLIMDIGGGSVEFIIANNETVFWLDSIEIGGQRLKDQFHQKDPIDEKSLDGIDEYLDFNLAPLLEALKSLRPNTLIGSSGTFDTLSDIYENKNNLDSSQNLPEGKFEISEFKNIHQQLLSKPLKERIEIPGMTPFRAEMIVVATRIIDWTLRNSQIDEIRISRYSMKEGILSSLLNKIK